MTACCSFCLDSNGVVSPDPGAVQLETGKGTNGKGTPKKPVVQRPLHGRKPMYVAARLRGLNDLDVSRGSVAVALRLFVFWKETNEQYIEEARMHFSGKRSMCKKDDASWKELKVQEKWPELDILGKRTDHKDEVEVHFKFEQHDRFCGINMMHTCMMNRIASFPVALGAFPFDRQWIEWTLHLPKTKEYAFQVDQGCDVPSENVRPITAGGKGVFEVTEDVHKQLRAAGWTLVRSEIDASQATPRNAQAPTKVIFRLLVRRDASAVTKRFLVPYALLSFLVYAAAAFDHDDLASRASCCLLLMLLMLVFFGQESSRWSRGEAITVADWVGLLGQLNVAAFLVASALSAALDSSALAAWYLTAAAPAALLLSAGWLLGRVRVHRPIIISGRPDLLKRPQRKPTAATAAAPTPASYKDIKFQNLTPMLVMHLDDFKGAGRIPRSDQCKDLGLREVNLQRDIPIFISHNWWTRPAEATGYDAGAPDVLVGEHTNLKHRMICDGVEQLIEKNGWDRRNVVLWVDWFSITQEDADVKLKGVKSLIHYTTLCKAMLIPQRGKIGENIKYPEQLPIYGFRGWCRCEYYVFSCWSEMQKQESVQLYAVDESKQLKQFPTVRFTGTGDMPTEGQLTVETDRELIRTEVEGRMRLTYGHRMCGVAVEAAAMAAPGGETVDLAGKMLTECHVGTLLLALREHAPDLIRVQACRDRACNPC